MVNEINKSVRYSLVSANIVQLFLSLTTAFPNSDKQLKGNRYEPCKDVNICFVL